MSIALSNSLLMILLFGLCNYGVSGNPNIIVNKNPNNIEDFDCVFLKGYNESECRYGYDYDERCDKFYCRKNIGEECVPKSKDKQCRKNSICCGNVCVGCDNDVCDSGCGNELRKRFQLRPWQPREMLSDWIERQQQRLKSLNQQNEMQKHEYEQKFNPVPYFQFGFPRLTNEI